MPSLLNLFLVSDLKTPPRRDIESGSLSMETGAKRTFRIGLMAICLSSSFAFADISEEMKSANEHYDNQEMMDAAVIYKKLALQNYLPALARMGDIEDYTDNHESAVGWYIMAAFQGNADGATGLGRAYATGFGIAKDPNQALYWYKFAADKDDLNGIKAMEWAYQVGEERSGMAVKVDLKQSDYWKAKRIPLEEARNKLIKEKQQAKLKEIYEKQQLLKK